MTLQSRYKSDYVGEYIILETVWSGGQKKQVREWVKPTVDNQHLSGRAVTIISDIDRYQFDFSRLHLHRGGLLSSKKVQTYANSFISKQAKIDFTVETDYSQLTELIETIDTDTRIVYTTPRYCLDHPGKCHLIPYNPKLSVSALLLYMASFDEHKEIFMLGYTTQTPGFDLGQIYDCCQVFSAFKDVKFYCISKSHVVPEEFLKYPNVSNMDYRTWISHCDI